MARLSNHEIVEVWRHKTDPAFTFHVDKNHRVLRVFGQQKATAKLMYVLSDGRLRFGGTQSQVRADARTDKVREYLATYATKI